MCQKIKSLSAMVLSSEEKIKIVQFWYETRSFVSLKRSVRREYGCNPSETPHNNIISRSVHHFEKEVVVHGKNQGRSGRSPVVTGGSDKVEEVRESVCETPQTSTRHRSQALRMSRFTGVDPGLGSNCDLASKSIYVGSVSAVTVDRVRASFLERGRLCGHLEGAHIEHMLKQKKKTGAKCCF